MTELPCDIEAERAVLGAVLIDNRALDAALPHIGTNNKTWHDKYHAELWGTMLCLSDKGKPIDVRTIADELGDRLEDAGGAAYLAELASTTPISENAEHYAAIVRDKAIRRGLIASARKIAGLARDEDADIDEVLDNADSMIVDVGGRNVEEIVHVSTALSDAVTRLKTLSRANDAIPTGLEHLDTILGGGWQKGDFIVVGARPSVGKTQFGVLAARAAGRAGVPVLFVTMEMDALSLARRLLCLDGGVRLFRMQKGYLVEAQLAAAERASERLSQCPIHLLRPSNRTIPSIRSLARHAQHRLGIGLLIIDYVQLIHPAKHQRERYQEVAQISDGLKALAWDLRVPVIALAQLKRDAEGRRPTPADLKESGALEQDADVVLLLHETTVQDRDQLPRVFRSSEVNPVHEITGNLLLFVGKHRNGPRGVVDLYYEHATQRIVLAVDRKVPEPGEQGEFAA
jgi:replicative DNA helicase